MYEAVNKPSRAKWAGGGTIHHLIDIARHAIQKLFEFIQHLDSGHDLAFPSVVVHAMCRTFERWRLLWILSPRGGPCTAAEVLCRDAQRVHVQAHEPPRRVPADPLTGSVGTNLVLYIHNRSSRREDSQKTVRKFLNPDSRACGVAPP